MGVSLCAKLGVGRPKMRRRELKYGANLNQLPQATTTATEKGKLADKAAASWQGMLDQDALVSETKGDASLKARLCSARPPPT